MNPYPDRIAELHDHLESRWGQRDRIATEVLLAAHLSEAATGMRRPWLVIETDYPSRDMTDAWFSFGLKGTNVRSLAVPRVQRTQQCEETLQEWLSERRADRPGVFVDAEWRRPNALDAPKLYGKVGWRTQMTHTYSILLAQCVRLRVEHPRTDMAVRLSRAGDIVELARLSSRVLNSDHRQQMPAQPVPVSFLYWCELLQKLAPAQTDWEAMIQALAAIERGVAVLYNEARMQEWAVCERVMRDTIPFVTRSLIERAMERGEDRRAVYALNKMRKSRQGPDAYVAREMQRLAYWGVLLPRRAIVREDPYKWHPWRYKLSSHDWRDLLDREKRILA